MNPMTKLEQKPKELLDAIGELAVAIKPHNMDAEQRRRITRALHTLVDHIIATAALRKGKSDG